MGLGAYLLSRATSVLLLAFVMALVSMVLAVTGASSSVIVLVDGLLVLGFVCALAIDYGRRRGFYRELAEVTDSTAGDARLLADLLEEPSFAEGRIALDAIRAVTKSANDDVAAHRRQVEEYREYVETWVHEAKSPLAAAGLMLENLRVDPESAATDPARLDALDDELHRVDGYIEQALFFARSEAVDRDYLIRPHRLNELVGAAVRDNARELIAAHVTPRLDASLDVEVFADDKWLRFVLGQLLQNSVRYVREDAEGGSQVWFEARTCDAGQANERVELVVRDNGCGCSADDVPRVFDKGFTGENGRTHKRSTGIGLYLVRRLCDKMGLSVRAASEPGRGFTVTIAFPTNKMHYFER